MRWTTLFPKKRKDYYFEIPFTEKIDLSSCLTEISEVFSKMNSNLNSKKESSSNETLVEKIPTNNIELPKSKEKITQILGQLFAQLFDFEKKVEFSSFKLGATWPSEVVDESVEEVLRKKIQRGLIEKISIELNKKIDFLSPEIEFLLDFQKQSIFFRVNSVFLLGKYTKHARDIAQTKYYCPECRGRLLDCIKCNGTGKLARTSVEELIAEKLVPKFCASSMIFHGAGREDGDVLMLGTGRPFIVELICPLKRTFSVGELKKIQEEINSSFVEIKVNFIGFVNKTAVQPLKNSPHDKVYSAIVECESEFDLKKLDSFLLKKISVSQRTPVRVLRRRTDMLRAKEITILSFSKISPTEFNLELKSSHGTYIKEFISSDDNRTIPSIASILRIKCKCKQLDVLEICE